MWLVTDDVSGRWRPGIGDPSVMGWLTVFAYVLAALLCAGAARAVVQGVSDGVPLDERRRRLRRFWWGLTVAMLLLAVNKQLDLQTWMTELGKDLAVAQGWYASRREVQGLFVKVVAFLALALACVLSFRMRRFLRYTLWPLLGIVALLAFIIIRAASFHHLDLLLKKELLGIQTNWVFELSGIALVTWGGYRSGGGPWVRQWVRRYAFAGMSPRLPVPMARWGRRALQWLGGGVREIEEELPPYEHQSAAPSGYPRSSSRVHPGSPSPMPPPPSARPRGVPRSPMPPPVTEVEVESDDMPREELHIQVRVRDPGEDR